MYFDVTGAGVNVVQKENTSCNLLGCWTDAMIAMTDVFTITKMFATVSF